VNELFRLSLRELVSGVHGRRWTAVTVASEHIARIQQLEPRVQAWQHLEPARLMARAGAVRMDPALPLCGAPIAIKDIIDVSGMPTRYGSPIYASAPAARESAACVAALEGAGAIVVGKAVTTEFAYYTPGKTRNPWNLAHTPGGSSMGSAASVACGMATGALGTQTNGSVIRPAAFCGVVGYKPTFGSVPNHGTLDPWPTLDHTGVFARSVSDAALLASVIGGGNAALAAGAAKLDRPPRLAVVRSPVWDLAEAAQKARLAADADALARAGAHVETLALPAAFDDAHRVHRVIMAYEGARHFQDLQRHHRGQMSERFNDLLDEGAAIADEAYRAALDATRRLRAEYENVMEHYDAILTPPAAGEAPATLEETGNPAFCTIWTLLGVPALTIPVGVGTVGLPLGMQIVGRAAADSSTLAVAEWCEARLSWESGAVAG
jgi:Asp-tRNA(Asn)/Glu-tRNA(Gln) amidotransferase A subunit family amidase